MGWYTRFAIVAGAGLAALVVFLSLVAADGSSGSGPGVIPSGGPVPTSTTVPPNCDPPKMCPVVVDTDKDGYSDYDENAYGSDPGNPASTPESSNTPRVIAVRARRREWVNGFMIMGMSVPMTGLWGLPGLAGTLPGQI